MNKVKKNIVIVGFSELERNSISIPDLAEPYYDSQVIHYVDSMSDATKYQGYMIIINNSINKSLYEIDKKYRHTLNRFEKILLYNNKYKDAKINKWSRIKKIGRELFELDGYGLGEEWDRYKYLKEHENHKIIYFNKDKENGLNILYKYLKNYKTIRTNKIVNDLGIDNRTIQRYMIDLNNIYHNIGYDYSNNEWYFIW